MRFTPCSSIVEAMTALVIIDHRMRHHAQCLSFPRMVDNEISSLYVISEFQIGVVEYLQNGLNERAMQIIIFNYQSLRGI